MGSRSAKASLRMRAALLGLVAAAVGLAGVARGQESDLDPDPDWQESEASDHDAMDASAGEDDSGDSDVVDESSEDVVDDGVTGEEDIDAESAAAGDEDWQFVAMTEDEEWATEVLVDESDDAIPIDGELDPTGEDWEVVEFADDGDDLETAPDDATGDVRDPADMPIVRRPVQRARPAGAGDEDTPYSTGGKPIRDKGAPWQAQIFYPHSAPQWSEQLRKGTPLWQLQHYCGGTLIAPDWVLTAAHCIDEDMVKSGYRVRLGVNDISKGDGLSFKIDRIVRHSQYEEKLLPASPNMYANDIALVHIVDEGGPRSRDPARIRPIPLYEKPIAPGTEVTGTGWGKTEAVEGRAPSAVLMKVDLRVMDTERCRKLPGYGPQKIHGKVICAANPQRSTCQGDSGGGIILTNGAPTVVGIISWGKKRCSGDGQPGAYTRIESYLGWIRQAMQLEPSRNALP